MSSYVNSSGQGLSSGIIFINSSGASKSIANASGANYPLVSTAAGEPTFASPPDSIIINNQDFSPNPGVCYPSAGSAPISAYADLTSDSIPYSSSAYIGFSINYTPKSLVYGVLRATFTFPVTATTTAASGTQTLGLMAIALYTTQTASAPLIMQTFGSLGALGGWSGAVTVKYHFSAGSFSTGLNLYPCFFFDSNWTTSGCQAVICGKVVGGVVVARTTQQINAYVVETAPSATYVP